MPQLLKDISNMKKYWRLCTYVKMWITSILSIKHSYLHTLQEKEENFVKTGYIVENKSYIQYMKEKYWKFFIFRFSEGILSRREFKDHQLCFMSYASESFTSDLDHWFIFQRKLIFLNLVFNLIISCASQFIFLCQSFVV